MTAECVRPRQLTLTPPREPGTSLSLHPWESPAPTTALAPPCPWEVTSVTQCHPALQQEKGLACHHHRHIVTGMKTTQPVSSQKLPGKHPFPALSLNFGVLPSHVGPGQRPAPPGDSLDLLLQEQGHPDTVSQPRDRIPSVLQEQHSPKATTATPLPNPWKTGKNHSREGRGPSGSSSGHD